MDILFYRKSRRKHLGQEQACSHPPKFNAAKLKGSLSALRSQYLDTIGGKNYRCRNRRGGASGETRKYYVDWILARMSADGDMAELTAVEVQTIDTTGNYSDQAQKFFAGEAYIDGRGRTPGYSNAGMNWENVNKRILPQLIYKGHVLRREERCSKGLFFVCPRQVFDRIRDRLGGTLHEYRPGNGTITFRSYQLGGGSPDGQSRDLEFFDQFTTTVDQVALAFTSPMNLPDMNVYSAAITAALDRQN